MYEQRLVHEGADAVVTLFDRSEIRAPMHVNGATILEPGSPIVWFTFPGVAHDIGRFHLRDGTFTGFYANMLTPVEFIDRLSWRTTDLILDAWLSVGNQFSILDAEELEAALSSGAIHVDDADLAWAEMRRLQHAWKSGMWPPAVVHEWTLERASQATA